MLARTVTTLIFLLSSATVVVAMVGGEAQTGDANFQKHYYCNIAGIPTSWNTVGQPPLKVVRSSAVFYEVGSAVPDVDITNTGASTVIGLALVIEYQDKNGHTVYTAAISGTQKGLDKEVLVPFVVENPAIWEGPFSPGKTIRLQGFTNGNRTVTCPAAARITFAAVKLGNGDVQQYVSPGWSVPPVPKLLPFLSSTCPVVQSAPVEISGTLRINASGDVVAINSAATSNRDALSWAEAQVRGWKFHSAVVDGLPSDSELNVEFVFYGTSNPDFAGVSPSPPVVLIQFYPNSLDPSRRCVGAFAQLTDGTSIP